MRDGDGLLAFWIFCGLVWDVLCLGTCTYLVFWKGHSGWWFILAIMASCSYTLMKALQKRFGIEEQE